MERSLNYTHTQGGMQAKLEQTVFYA